MAKKAKFQTQERPLRLEDRRLLQTRNFSMEPICSTSQIPKLINGFIPQETEDKWFVYAYGPGAQGNVVLHMHRSWTGHKMVEAKQVIEINEDGEIENKDAQFMHILWESDEEKCRGQTKQGAKDMAKQVCHWCMDIQLP
jgi:hypothetical protein